MSAATGPAVRVLVRQGGRGEALPAPSSFLSPCQDLGLTEVERLRTDPHEAAARLSADVFTLRNSRAGARPGVLLGSELRRVSMSDEISRVYLSLKRAD